METTKEPTICTCKNTNCNKEYDVKNLVRTNGDVCWKNKYCSAHCYTMVTLYGVYGNKKS